MKRVSEGGFLFLFLLLFFSSLFSFLWPAYMPGFPNHHNIYIYDKTITKYTKRKEKLVSRQISSLPPCESAGLRRHFIGTTQYLTASH